MLRFHLDENVDLALVSVLRQRGLDVTSTPPDMPKQSSDAEQMAFASSQKRVIVSHDADMLVEHRRGVQHAGIVFCRFNSRTIGQIAAKLTMMARQLEPEDMYGRIEYL